MCAIEHNRVQHCEGLLGELGTHTIRAYQDVAKKETVETGKVQGNAQGNPAKESLHCSAAAQLI
jgi:hypothetical protein